MAETRIHPETGKTLHRSVRQQIVRFGSLSEVVEVPGWYPDDGSDSVHSGSDLKASNDAFSTLRAAYAARVKSVRKKLRLTQEQAGHLIGGGKRAFQKYESGRIAPSDAAVGLIELLSRHPEELETLRGFRPTATEGVQAIERRSVVDRGPKRGILSASKAHA